MRNPLDPFSKVLDERSHWDPEWYSWLTEVSSNITADAAKIAANTAAITVNTANTAANTAAITANSPALTKVKFGSFTRDTTLPSGSQVITGIGFTPRVLFMLSGSGGAGVAGVSITTQPGVTGMLFWLSTSYYSTLDNRNAVIGNDLTNRVDGAVTLFSNDGFTIAWSKAGAPTALGLISYIALG